MLYQRYARVVHAVLLARVSPADADDLVQEVFLRALRQLRRLRQPGAFGGWLMAVARNCAHDHHRRRRELNPLPADVPVVAASADRVEAEAVLAAIRGLPEAYRETLLLRLVEGMSGPEIARRTGLTADSVRVNLHRGMKLLRERLEVRRS